MVLVGLTGGIASGKSAVADLLAAKGAVIIDADVLAREVVEPGTPGLAAVVLVALILGTAAAAVITAVAVAVLALAAQLMAVRPRLRRRSDAVLADSGAASGSRSRAHYAYLALEIVKVVGLIAGGVALLAGLSR